MLETIRQYALDKLSQSKEAEGVRRLHLMFFLRLAEKAEPGLQGEEQLAWLNRLEVEQGNMHAALQWALVSGEIESGLRLCGALAEFWEMRGYYTEGRELLGRALECAAEAPAGLRAKVLRWAGRFTERQGDLKRAQECLEESLELGRALGDKLGIAQSLHRLAFVAGERCDYVTERTLYEQALALYREVGDKRGVADALHNLGVFTLEQGDPASARAFLEESLTLKRTLGDMLKVNHSLLYLAMVARLEGDYEQAAALCQESLAFFREEGDKRRIARCLQILGRVVKDQGNGEQALALCQGSLSLFWELGAKLAVADSLWALGGVALAQGQPERTARLFGTAQALHTSLNSGLSPINKAEYERDIAAARAQLGEAAFVAAWMEGETMPLEQAVEYALGTENAQRRTCE
ncbi:MAG: tetratricopeptide repeat protein [Chloroflexi bacterium]|nr:tetratricopeptide repeat protein [Chloroflexota bacterium]